MANPEATGWLVPIYCLLKYKRKNVNKNNIFLLTYVSVISIIFLTDSKNQVKFKTLFKVTDRITRFGVSAIFHSDHENGCAVPPAE